LILKRAKKQSSTGEELAWRRCIVDNPPPFLRTRKTAGYIPGSEKRRVQSWTKAI
jgi:hypothetical protein